MNLFQILVLVMLAYISYRLTVLGPNSFLNALATVLIFGLEKVCAMRSPMPSAPIAPVAIINLG